MTKPCTHAGRRVYNRIADVNNKNHVGNVKVSRTLWVMDSIHSSTKY